MKKEKKTCRFIFCFYLFFTENNAATARQDNSFLFYLTYIVVTSDYRRQAGRPANFPHMTKLYIYHAAK